MTGASFHRSLHVRASVVMMACCMSVAALVAAALHARGARSRAARDLRALPALAAQLPAPDVAFTGGARWLRAPSLEEPGAAQADGIAFPDPEPGGGALVPPRAAWTESLR